MSKQGDPNYPGQNYPSAPPPNYAGAYGPGPQGPPPPYSPPTSYPAAYGVPPGTVAPNAYPPTSMPPGMALPHGAYYPPYYPPASHHGQMPPQQRPVNVVVRNAFDPGARFDHVSQASIPPPPPGVAPNAAQVAAMQGHNVVGTQKKENFWFGSAGGGYTWF